MRDAVGFYWTLPVPWAGFTSLPDSIDDAAKVSRTVRYQREAIRRHAREQRYRLIHEEVFLEIVPDRGSEIILDPLHKVERICRSHDAVLLFVDFSEVQGWRSHQPMIEWSRRTGIDVEPIFPGELIIEGQTFDPHAHFRAWRDRQESWSASKPKREAAASARARFLRAQGLSWGQVAESMNDENLRSLSGRPWTADSLRKFLAAHPAD